jgi:FG-GAP-like repeat
MLNITTKKINISTPLTSGSFSYSDISGFTYANGDVYAFDYNNDGVQEVLFSAFETQYNTPENFTNSNVSIFGWKDGKLINLTSTLLPGTNRFVEGTGDVAFGDFNGDGLVHHPAL